MAGAKIRVLDRFKRLANSVRTRFSLAPLPLRIAILAAIAAIPAVLLLQQTPGDPAPASPAFDRFGIRQLFPTKDGGREWFMDLENPRRSGEFEVSNGQKISRAPDGFWYSEGMPPEHRTRIMIESPPDHEPWINVEMTGYFKVERTFGHEPGKPGDDQNAFQAYARGGTHSNQLMAGSDGKLRNLNCVGSGYKGRIYFDGSVDVAKEIGHSVYAPPRYAQGDVGEWDRTGSGQFSPLVRSYNATDGHFYGGRWIGLKVVIYNIGHGSPDAGVGTLVYIDNQAENQAGGLQPSNNWRLLADVVDAGDWAVEHLRVPNATAEPDEHDGVDTVQELVQLCGNPFGTIEEYASMVITWPGHPAFIDDPAYRALANAASFRWDYAGAKFTYLSVREIDPPANPPWQ